jgi:hypothetical protein
MQHSDTQNLTVVASAPGSYSLRATLTVGKNVTAPPIVLDVTAHS